LQSAQESRREENARYAAATLLELSFGRTAATLFTKMHGRMMRRVVKV